MAKFIANVKVTDSWVHTQKGLEEAFHDHFVDLIGKPISHAHSLDLNFLNMPSHDLRELEAGFTENEVSKAIKCMPSKKALGPDGFTGLFYQCCWKIIKSDIMAAFHVLGRLAGKNAHLLN